MIATGCARHHPKSNDGPVAVTVDLPRATAENTRSSIETEEAAAGQLLRRLMPMILSVTDVSVDAECALDDNA